MRIHKFAKFESVSSNDPDVEELNSHFEDLELEWDVSVDTIEYKTINHSRGFLVQLTFSEKKSIKEVVNSIYTRIERLEKMTNFIKSTDLFHGYSFDPLSNIGEESFGKISISRPATNHTDQLYINNLLFSDFRKWIEFAWGSQGEYDSDEMMDMFDKKFKIESLVLNFEKIN